MLANLRRKVGLGSGITTPAPSIPPPGFQEMVLTPTSLVDPTLPAPFTMEELGFGPGGIVSPSVIPLWLQEQVSRITGIFLETGCSHSSRVNRASTTLDSPRMDQMASSCKWELRTVGLGISHQCRKLGKENPFKNISIIIL